MLPVPAIVSRLVPFVTGTLTVNKFDELLVQLCAAARLIVNLDPLSVKVAPLFIVIPPPAMSRVTLGGPPDLVMVGLPSSTVILWAPSFADSVTVNAFTASVPAEKKRSSVVVVLVVKVPAPPVEFVFQKLEVPQVPVGVAPAPSVAPLLSQ